MFQLKLFFLTEISGCEMEFGVYKIQIEDTTIKDRYKEFKREGNMKFDYNQRTLYIDRKRLLESLQGEIKRVKGMWHKGSTFSIKFKGEPGIDCGGPSREFFDLFGTKLMAHDLKIFSINSEGRLNLDLKAHTRYDCIEI
jgi:hypothetical protein